MDNSSISNCEKGIHCSNARFRITNSNFSNNDSYSISASDNSDVEISGSEIDHRNHTGTPISVSNSSLDMYDSDIWANESSPGFNCSGSLSHIYLQNSCIAYTSRCLYLSDAEEVTVNNCSFYGSAGDELDESVIFAQGINSFSIVGQKFPGYTIKNGSKAMIFSICDNVSITDCIITDMINDTGVENHGIRALRSNLIIDNLSLDGIGDEDTDYGISLESSDLTMDNSILSNCINGVCVKKQGQGVVHPLCMVEIKNSSIHGDNQGYYGIRAINTEPGMHEISLLGRHYSKDYTIGGYENGIYCFEGTLSIDGILLYTDMYDDRYCVIRDINKYGMLLQHLDNGSFIMNTDFINCGYNSTFSRGAIFLWNSQPNINRCLFSGNTGPSIFAYNNSNAFIGRWNDDNYGNQFELNCGYDTDHSAIIYESYSHTQKNTRYNNFYRGTNLYYLKNEQSIGNSIDHNYWDTYPDWDGYFDPPISWWEYNPVCLTPCTFRPQIIPDGGGGGGGTTPLAGTFESGLLSEENQDFEQAVSVYEGIVSNSFDEKDRRVALHRVLSASLKGNLQIQPLIGYFQSIASTTSDPITEKAALRLKTKVKEHMGDFNDAICDYENILQDNPTLEDSVYAILGAGHAHLMKNTPGMQTASQNPGQGTPQMAELEPENYDEYLELVDELLNLLHSGTSIAGNGTGTAMLLPEDFAIHQNFPNPFNPATEINYDLPEMANVRIDIYNVLGQRVYTLVDGIESAGFKSVTWHGKSGQGGMVSSGMYIYKITAEGRQSGEKFVKSSKMLLLQ